MSKIETKYIDWSDVPDKVKNELVTEADLVANDDLDSRIVLYEATINNILIADKGMEDNDEDREFSIELVNFISPFFDHDTDWYIIE
jgi:hypothetical protein